MLARLQNTPQTEEDWAIWSWNNYDCLNQIRSAINSRYAVTLPDYQVEPIDFGDIDTWLQANQQAHTEFAGVLGIQTSDLLHVDLRDQNQRQAWIFTNWMELSNACQTLKIGP